MSIVVTDQMQRTVTLPAPAKRIVSLVPSQTELLFTLGAGGSVVGLTRFCTEPPDQVAGITKVGGTKKFDFEAIAALQPDLIIGNKEENYPEGIAQLEQDYPVWMSDISTLDESLEMVRGIGEITGHAEQAEVFVRSVNQNFKTFLPAQFSKVNVAYLIWQKPFMAAGGNTFINDILARGGMHNVLAHLPRYPEVSLEQLASCGAEYILLSSEPFPFREKHMAQLNAELPDQKFLLVDAMPFSWYGSQLLHTADYLRQLRTQF